VGQFNAVQREVFGTFLPVLLKQVNGDVKQLGSIHRPRQLTKCLLLRETVALLKMAAETYKNLILDSPLLKS
jgi:hypothetical protein